MRFQIVISCSVYAYKLFLMTVWKFVTIILHCIFFMRHTWSKDPWRDTWSWVQHSGREDGRLIENQLSWIYSIVLIYENVFVDECGRSNHYINCAALSVVGGRGGGQREQRRPRNRKKFIIRLIWVFDNPNLFTNIQPLFHL